MTVNAVDCSFHGAAFPTSYIVPGTLRSDGVVLADMLVGNIVNTGEGTIAGNVTSAGNATKFYVGFQPSHIVAYNETAGVFYEWYQGMGATDAVVSTFTGPVMAKTGSRFTITKDVSSGNANVAAVTFSATIMGSSTNNVIFRFEA